MYIQDVCQACIDSSETNCRPTNKPADQQKNGKLEVGIADDQAKDFDFEKTEMKYDSTGMFHWTPARSIEDCILVRKLEYFILVRFSHQIYVFGSTLANPAWL